MALRPQTSPGLQDMLVMGVVRVGTAGELYKPDGSALIVPAASIPKAANVPLAAGATPTKAEYDALVNALIAAGFMAAP